MLLLFAFVVVIWTVELVDLLALDGRLDAYGIEPRDEDGLRGIVLAPFLHGGLAHVASNTVPLVALGLLTVLRRLRDLLVVTGVGGLVSGLGVWLTGTPGTVHIGASGVVFAYLGFLLARGWFDRTPASIFVAVAVALVYGGLLLGIVPSAPGISWQGHLFGFLGGVLAARLLAARRGNRLDRRSLARSGGV